MLPRMPARVPAHLAWLAVLAAVTLLTSTCPALAAWSGAATGDKTATDTNGVCTWRSTLNPEPALQMSDCPWMHDALTKMGYTAANGWTINYATALQGSLDIREYYAWVSDEPDVTNRHGTTYAGVATGEIGGAVLNVDYNAAGADPTAGVHWIQVIKTNSPSAYGQANGYDAGGGYYEYIDNAPNPAGNPYYDFGYAAGSDWFIDVPWRECPPSCNAFYDWDAQLFLATGNLATKNLTLYTKGIWWGYEFTCVPEPATMTVLIVGLAAVIRRRRS